MRRIERIGVAALAVAALGVMSVSGAIAQQEDGIYGGDVVTPGVASEAPPAATDAGAIPSDLGAVPSEDIAVPDVAPSTLGDDVQVPEVTPTILGGETQVPEVIESTLGSDIPANVPIPVHLTAIFGEDFPFPDEDSAEGVIGEVIGAGGADESAEGAIGDINVGGTDSGTITLGGGEGGISIGGGAGEGSVVEG